MNELVMSDTKRRPARKIHIWILLSVAAAVVLAANAHLVYIAITSQPPCVAHVKPGETGKPGEPFSAAKSSCSPAASAAGVQP